MRVVLKHPARSRRKSFTRSQLARAERYLAAGWQIVEPAEPSLQDALNVAETGAPVVPADTIDDGPETGSVDVWVSLDLVQQVPEGTVPEVLAWVAEDTHRARAALVVERETQGRSTLIRQLETIANP